jgi:hypothetical protein
VALKGRDIFGVAERKFRAKIAGGTAAEATSSRRRLSTLQTLHDNTINEDINRIEPAYDLGIFSRWLKYNRQWIMKTPSMRKIPTTRRRSRSKRAGGQLVRKTFRPADEREIIG